MITRIVYISLPPNSCNRTTLCRLGCNLSFRTAKLDLFPWCKSSSPKINILLFFCSNHPFLRERLQVRAFPVGDLFSNDDDRQDSSAQKEEDDAAAREAISEILQEFGASKEDSMDIALRSPKYLAMLIDSVRELDELSLWVSWTERRRRRPKNKQNCSQEEEEEEGNEEESTPLSFKEKVYYMAKEKGDKGKLPFLESLGVGLPSATHLARSLSSQTLPNLIIKVKYVKEMFFSNSDDEGLVGKKARRMMMHLSIPVDEDVQQTLSFFEKIEAKRGGLDILDSRDATFRYLIESFPRLLLLSLESHMKPMVKFLEDIGVPSGRTRNILILFPPIMFYDIQKDIKLRIRAFEKVGIIDVGGMLLKYPWILSSGIQENYKEIVSFFVSEKVPRVSVDLAIKSLPLLLGSSVTKLEVMVEQFAKLGVRNRKLGRVMEKSPQLLLRKTQEIVQVVSFLKDVGLDEEIIGNLLGLRPDIFAANVEETLKKKLDFLTNIGVSESHLPCVIKKYPQIFVSDVNRTILPRMEYLMDVGFSERDVVFMVCGFPPLLGYSKMKVLMPKVEFLVNTMKKPLQDVVDYPRYFSYSLEKKIKPRYWLLKGRKVECSLKDMLGKNDEDFVSEFIGVERMLASSYLQTVVDMLSKDY